MYSGYSKNIIHFNKILNKIENFGEYKYSQTKFNIFKQS